MQQFVSNVHRLPLPSLRCKRRHSRQTRSRAAAALEKQTGGGPGWAEVRGGVRVGAVGGVLVAAGQLAAPTWARRAKKDFEKVYTISIRMRSKNKSEDLAHTTH